MFGFTAKKKEKQGQAATGNEVQRQLLGAIDSLVADRVDAATGNEVERLLLEGLVGKAEGGETLTKQQLIELARYAFGNPRCEHLHGRINKIAAKENLFFVLKDGIVFVTVPGSDLEKELGG